MRPPSPAAAVLSRVLTAGSLACVVVLTLIDRGATRAHSSPWHLLFWFAHLAPLAALALRTLLPSGPAFTLPPRSWTILASAFAALVLLSALASPYRGPALLNALTPLAALAAFFLLHDWLNRDRPPAARHFVSSAALFSTAIVLLSVAPWLRNDFLPAGGLRHWSQMTELRNARPLGHSNYTAGLALLVLPWLGALAGRSRTWIRGLAVIAVLVALFMLSSSGSRGGLLGFAALALTALLFARLNWKKLLLIGFAAGVISFALAYIHPRTRAALFTRSVPSATPNVSNVQRSAMLTAGLRMGVDRPLAGWGPGTIPLVYPRYRAGLQGGAENVLQLHSTPLQLWAELGAPGFAAGLGFLMFAFAAARRRDPPPVTVPAATALAGYVVFAVTDYQLDVPVFALAVAALAAALAPAPMPVSTSRARLAGFGALLVLVLVALLGRPDPAPTLNVRALALAREPARAADAIALLNESLALNPDQEIAHFNLGWLLVVRDPAAAARHFRAAAHLVPDKGGVYFGLALARLNQTPADPSAVARLLALEALNDPLFLTSPWWREPAFAPLRPATFAALRLFAGRAADTLEARGDPRSREARYLAALAAWLDGTAAPGEILAAARTSERVRFFAARPPVPDFAVAAIRSYRRERTGYPVLMRDLDLPTPGDLYDVQENALAAGELSFLFPSKGWLPSPVLTALLDAPVSAKP